MTVYKSGYARAKCSCAHMNTCETSPACPTVMDNTVMAGMACESPCTDIGAVAGVSELAKLQFPIQEYTYGFCPTDALEKGTLFPEFVQSCGCY